MKRALLWACLLVATPALADSNDVTRMLRGRYLVTAGDCIACHTGSRGEFAGGRAVETPFGNITAPNITPDDATGIGTWTEAQFARAMHEGVSPRVGRLYPAFPYPWYTRITREDSDAIYAYLRSLPPVANDVPRDTLPFPFDIRLSMAGWNWLNFTPGRFEPNPQRSAEWNRGAYLVEGLGHCAACHTPRSLTGGDEAGAQMQGGPLQGWFAPNITTHRQIGIGDWSVEEIVRYLRTGVNNRSIASGPMAEVVAYSTSRLTEEDLRAMATYLREQPARGPDRPTPLAADTPVMRQGEALYVDNCMACHRRDGMGVPGLIPRLAGSAVVQQSGPETLLHMVISGARAVATDAEPTGPAMPSFGWRLNDDQVAAVTSYVRNAWGNAAPPAGADDARRMRDRVQAATR